MCKKAENVDSRIRNDAKVWRMDINKIGLIRESVKRKQPLIHCITNPISIHACANAVLAVGARPIMAEHPKEAAEITETAKALMLNLGNITDVRMESMMIAARTAKCGDIPVLLDCVGAACSRLRREYALNLIDTVTPTVIKGNYSEIKALCASGYTSSGVDAEAGLETAQIGKEAAQFAKARSTVVLASGKTDIITDGKQIIYIKNGSPQLASVTGTGCMLGALCAGYLSADRSLYAAAAACAVMGICGELSETEKGSGTFMVNLMDRLSTLQKEELEDRIKMEGMNVENA